MTRRTPRLLMALVLLALMVATNCERTRITRPANHRPTIESLTVFPTDMGPSDSAIVTCLASDPDGDTLVYDWTTDMRLSIKGNPPNVPIKSNTLENAETFYPHYQPTRLETLWVVCEVRDQRAGTRSEVVTFTIHPQTTRRMSAPRGPTSPSARRSR